MVVRKLLLAGLLLCMADPAGAVPGQTRQELIAWQKSNPVITELRFNAAKMESDEADYNATVQLSRGSLKYYVFFNDKGRVTKEGLELDGPIYGLDFNRSNVNTINLIKNIYGEAIARDFATARHVMTYRHDAFPNTVRAYLGKRFGYEWTAAHGDIQEGFGVMTLYSLQQRLAQVGKPGDPYSGRLIKLPLR